MSKSSCEKYNADCDKQIFKVDSKSCPMRLFCFRKLLSLSSYILATFRSQKKLKLILSYMSTNRYPSLVI